MRAVPKISKVSTAGPERCTKAFAPTAARNVKFHFGQREIDLSTAQSAGLRTDRQEEKTAAKEYIPGKTVREHHHRLPKTLIYKFWLS